MQRSFPVPALIFGALQRRCGSQTTSASRGRLSFHGDWTDVDAWGYLPPWPAGSIALGGDSATEHEIKPIQTATATTTHSLRRRLHDNPPTTSMDVVLEVADTFLLDRLYATVLPISSAVSSFDPVSTIAASLKSYDYNATSDHLGHGSFVRSGWQYQPSTQYFSLDPSEAAYMSRWDRNNVFRQTLSLYAITW